MSSRKQTWAHNIGDTLIVAVPIIKIDRKYDWFLKATSLDDITFSGMSLT